MLNFAIIGPNTQNTLDLQTAIRVSGHQSLVIELKDVRFEIRDDSLHALYKDLDMDTFDIIIFRGYNARIDAAKTLAKLLISRGKTIIEESLGGNYIRGKMAQAEIFAKNHISHPATFHADTLEKWPAIFSRMTFPIIAKPNFGRKGRGVEKIDSNDKAIEFLAQEKDDYIAQEYFPIKSDYRVFVVNNQVLGGFQRFINEGQYKSNIHGTRAEKIVVGKDMAAISVAATKSLGYEVAGVDILEHAGRLYIIEVNVAPQWEKFKAITSINPADSIIAYALEKHFRLKNAR